MSKERGDHEPSRKRRRSTEDEQQKLSPTAKPPGRHPARNARPNSWEQGSARPKKHAVHPIKKRIRDIQRLLGGGKDLPADMRVGLERELAECAQNLMTTEAAIQRQEMVRKYHMVRFFDRQKATRRLKKFQKQLDATDDPSALAALKKNIHVAEVDLNYTLHFPLDQPYPSLWPKTTDADGKTRTDREAAEAGIRNADSGMWRIVERCMEEGTLEALRDGGMTRKVTFGAGPPVVEAGQRVQRSKRALQRPRTQVVMPGGDGNERKAKKRKGTAEGDGSDGSGEGFFDDEVGGVRLP